MLGVDVGEGIDAIAARQLVAKRLLRPNTFHL